MNEEYDLLTQIYDLSRNNGWAGILAAMWFVYKKYQTEKAKNQARDDAQIERLIGEIKAQRDAVLEQLEYYKKVCNEELRDIHELLKKTVKHED